MIELKKKLFILTSKLHDHSNHHMQPRNRGVHGPVRSGFNPKIQPNQKIVFLVNITRTKPRIASNRTGFVRFGSVF